ncbi:ABC transporter permease [Deinococcus pimensis]|uniref:ABC transporter permease n=1 Tax=Deinococcus pimensis TaxID=309888 RepID=UPI00146F99B2|nr:ABC transporter permease [Deinococcus pimensis]
MSAALRAEWLKSRRTAALWIPSVVTLLVVGIAVASAPDVKMTLMMLQILWLTAWTPISCALTAGMSADLESRAGAWRVLRARATPPVTLYVAKLLFVFLAVLASNVLMAVTTTVLGVALHSADAFPWSVAWQLAGIATVVSVPLLLLHLWIATWRGLGASLLVGFLGLLLAQPAGPVWPFVPWTWFGKLTSSDAAGPSLMVALLVVGVWTVLVATWTLRWFARREDI